MKETAVQAGGMLTALWVCHLIGDWMLQTHDVASKKASDHRIRAWHCAVYCVPIGILLYLISPFAGFLVSLIWIFATHFVIDTYVPLFHFRRLMGDPDAKDLESYKASFGTPRGFYVLVTLDQIFHLLTLVPVAVLLVLE